MNENILARAEQALDGITPGPWKVNHYRYTETNARRLNVLARGRRNPVKAGDIYKSEVTPVAEVEGGGEGGISNPADAEFIAAARALVPELLAELREARREGQVLADTEELLRSHRDDLRAERDEWMARAHEAAGASLAAQKWHGTHSERMESERDVARAATERVRTLHQSGHIGSGYHIGSEYICEECSRWYGDPVPYPCPTIRALDTADE